MLTAAASCGSVSGSCKKALFAAMSPDFKLSFDILPVDLQSCFTHQNDRKHLVYHVSKFHKDCSSSFVDMTWLLTLPSSELSDKVLHTC